MIITGSTLSNDERLLASFMPKKDYYSVRKVGEFLETQGHKTNELIYLFQRDLPLMIYCNELFGIAYLYQENKLVFG